MTTETQINNLVMYKFLVEFRSGKIEGLFISTLEHIKNLYGKNLYFGEILGKHSEIEFELEESDISIVTEDQEYIARTIEIFKGYSISGYNPFDYMLLYENNEDEY